MIKFWKALFASLIFILLVPLTLVIDILLFPIEDYRLELTSILKSETLNKVFENL